MERLARGGVMNRFLLAALLLTACAPETAERYHTGETAEDIVALFNEREYGKAIFLLEQRHGKDPESPEIAFLLGEAYLGRAGFEPLAFAAKVSGPESRAGSLFPKCPSSELRKFSGDPKCLLERVYLHAPDADRGDFARARALLRRAYPEASRTPAWANTLIGLVETVSFVKRAGDLFRYAKGLRSESRPSDRELLWLKAQGKESLREAQESLARAAHAGPKIARLLTGLRDNAWFQSTEKGIHFASRLGLSRFLDFLRDHLLGPSDEIRYGELLEKVRALAEEESL